VISDPSHLWIQVDANEQDLPKFKPGQRLVIRSRAFPDGQFIGRVDVIADSLDPVTKIIRVRGSVDNRSRLLKAEMYVTVELTGDAPAGMDVPSKAVFSKGVKNYVFLEESRGEFSRKEIKAGPAHDGRTLILDGLQPGQRVVAEGCLLLEQLRQSTAGS
jgi:cobalt-zinc-cadmium efflux system membrane fusion protein